MRSGVDFFDTVDGTEFNTKSTECAAPGINRKFLAISNDSIFRTDESTAVTGNTNGSDL